MSAQPQKVADWQQTPVIIKTGGDTDPYAVGIEPGVGIESPAMRFRETIPGPTSKVSYSTKKGRLQELSIVEGPETTDFPITPDDRLASITISFGSAQFVLWETGDPHNNDVDLILMSEQVPFSVSSEPDWNDASVPFEEAVTGVLFLQGDRVVVERRYPAPNPLVSFVTNFQRNEGQ